jgi:monovalent cation/proton antiporter MnhG/PhaG subunit
MIENAGSLLLTAGAILIFFAALSIIRFTDIYSKANTFVKLACFGMFCLSLGIFTLSGFSAIGLKALLLCVVSAATLPAGILTLLKASRSAGIEISEEETKNKD